MNNYERDVLLLIANGDERVFPIMFLMCTLPYTRKGEVFRYMIKKGIIGRHLIEAYDRNQRSPFKLYKAVLDRIDGLMSSPLSTKDLS